MEKHVFGEGVAWLRERQAERLRITREVGSSPSLYFRELKRKGLLGGISATESEIRARSWQMMVFGKPYDPNNKQHRDLVEGCAVAWNSPNGMSEPYIEEIERLKKYQREVIEAAIEGGGVRTKILYDRADQPELRGGTMNLQEELTNVRLDQATVFDVAREAFGGTEDGSVGQAKFSMEVSHKQLPRLRAETPPRKHQFHTAHALADYLAKYGTKRTVVYCDLDLGRFTAVLDETPAWGEEHVAMVPLMHPRWKPWNEIVGKKISVKDLAKFLRKHRRDVVEPDGRELVMALSQVTASISVTRHVGSGKDALNGILVKTKIQGTEKSNIVELPESLILEVPLFVGAMPGTMPSRMEVDLVLEANGEGEVAATLIAPDLEADKQAELQGGVDHLRARKELIDLGVVVVLGAPAWSEWQYVERSK